MLSGFVQNTRRLPVETEQTVGDHNAGGERGRAGPESFADGDVVVDFERDGGQRSADVFRYCECRFPDEIVGAG